MRYSRVNSFYMVRAISLGFMWIASLTRYRSSNEILFNFNVTHIYCYGTLCLLVISIINGFRSHLRSLDKISAKRKKYWRKKRNTLLLRFMNIVFLPTLLRNYQIAAKLLSWTSLKLKIAMGVLSKAKYHPNWLFMKGVRWLETHQRSTKILNSFIIS